MSKFPDDVDPEEFTVVTRRVLLDALEALAEHRKAIVLVGGQAVHIRTARTPLVSSAYTSDADLSLDPAQVLDQPLLQEAMKAAGFEMLGQPGAWTRQESIHGALHRVAVDLMVPDKLTSNPGSQKRGVPIDPHFTNAARRTPGLEAAMFDFDELLVPSLEPHADQREIVVQVAGPAALLIAKAFKIRDRLADPRPGREADKDAADVVRIMTVAGDVRSTFDELAKNTQISEVVEEARELLVEQFGFTRAPGVTMAVNALAGDMAADRIRILIPTLVKRHFT